MNYKCPKKAFQTRHQFFLLSFIVSHIPSICATVAYEALVLYVVYTVRETVSNYRNEMIRRNRRK